MRWFLACLAASIIALASPGCDRTPAVPKELREKTDDPADAHPMAQFTTVAPFEPGRTTHLAADRAGNVMVVQETANGQDVMTILERGEIPRTSKLSTETILRALGLDEGEGNIQSILAIDDGDVLFYFSGGHGRQTAACLGVYTPAAERVRILADTRTLADETRLGASIGLARGRLIPDKGKAWLWVCHSDAFALLQMDPGKMGADGVIPVEKRLDKTFADQKDFPLTREQYSLAAGPGDRLMMLDLFTGGIWRIDPEDGSARLAVSLAGMPAAMSNPVFDRRGRMLMFVADSDPIESRGVVANLDTVVMTKYPAVLILEGLKLRTIPADDLLSHRSFPLKPVRLAELVAEPVADSWLGYDSASGYVVRMTLVDQP